MPGDVHVVVVRDAVSRRDGEVAAHRVVGHFNDTMVRPARPAPLDADDAVAPSRCQPLL